jgi:hypothetical protein
MSKRHAIKEGMEVKRHEFLTLSLDGSDQLHVPITLPPAARMMGAGEVLEMVAKENPFCYREMSPSCELVTRYFYWSNNPRSFY